MADNELTVIRADAQSRTLRSFDQGGVHIQSALVSEMPEVPVAGGTVRYTVTASASVPLVPPALGTFRYGRMRVYENPPPTTTAPSSRLYYRQDNTAPTNDGANAVGYMMHGDVFLIRVANPANFRMIGQSGLTTNFLIYVEWLTIPSS